MDERIAACTRTLMVDALKAAMIAHSVAAGRIDRAQDMLADRTLLRLGRWSRSTARAGEFRNAEQLPALLDTQGSLSSLAPAHVGQENERVYRDLLGIYAAEIARLRDEGVI